jgi:hypothetical protein
MARLSQQHYCRIHTNRKGSGADVPPRDPSGSSFGSSTRAAFAVRRVSDGASCRTRRVHVSSSKRELASPGVAPDDLGDFAMRVATGVTLVCLGFLANVRDARADDAAVARPAPYSLPWSLRPAALPTVLRVDSTLAMRDEDTVVATVLTLGMKMTDEVGFLARGALVHGIDGKASDSAVGNPLVGALYSPHVTESLRCGVFIAIAAPLGMGGGNSADPNALALMRAAIPARSSMDNALFATNYLTKAVGLSLAYVANGLTAQIEATAFMLERTRGGAVDRETTRINFTSGAHVGYAVLPWLTSSVEVRYQRWLSTPLAVVQDSSRRDNLTLALGLRGTWKVSEKVVLRPGVAYVEPLDRPMVDASYRMIQLDLPLIFP